MICSRGKYSHSKGQKLAYHLGVGDLMATLKPRFLRAFAGSVLGAVTGATVAALCTTIVVLKAIVEKDPGVQGFGVQDFGMLYLVVGLIAATGGAFWGALFGAILGFCDFARSLNLLLGVAFGAVLGWYLSHIFYGFPLALRIGCFPLMMGACYCAPLLITRFALTIARFWSRA